MAKRSTALTGTAGEHYVAYRLSALRYPVALTGKGSPTIDLMVGDLHGNAAISVQVKTSSYAWREVKRKPDDSHWEWPVNRKALDLRGDSIFYAFVDLNEAGLKEAGQGPSIPDVFIVPSADVAAFFSDPNCKSWAAWYFFIWQKDKARYHERWDLIVSRLRIP